MSDHRLRVGSTGERIAREHLRARGYEVLDRNFRTRHGELDIIATAPPFLVFCEVKTRVASTPGGPFGPLTAVGPRKRRKLREMARQWLATDRGGDRRRPAELRFDAIGVTLDRGGRLLELEHVEGAF